MHTQRLETSNLRATTTVGAAAAADAVGWVHFVYYAFASSLS